MGRSRINDSCLYLTVVGLHGEGGGSVGCAKIDG